VCSIAQKKTQSIKPCAARLYGFLGGIGYVPADEERKHLNSDIYPVKTVPGLFVAD